jgi:hypothetical protein
MSSGTIAVEHAALLDAAQRLLAHLRDFRSRFIHKRDSHMIHYDFADRGLSLETYLSAAMELANRGSYMPSLAVLRSALEHQLVDQLLFLGRRYKRKLTDVKRTDFNKWH